MQTLQDCKIETSKEDRALIEEFMGFPELYLPFCLRWNEIMPVVEKIENTTVTIKENFGDGEEYDDIRDCEWQFSVEVVNTQCMINQDVLPQYYGTDQDFLKTYDCRNEGKITKLEATYKAVIEFIKWYNLNK